MTDANTTDAVGGAVTVDDPLPAGEAEAVIDDVIENVRSVIVGHEEPIEHVLVAMLAGGHVLVEDVPGVGKTMLARSVAQSIDCTFKRVQFTPDLLPADITGANVFNQQSREFEFRPGPVFANVVLGDEINRAPPKTQSALLEAMEERQVTVDGTTHALEPPFTVIATQNEVEPNRTYELPLAELDRFMKKISLGYPEEDQEVEILDRMTGEHPIEHLGPVTDRETIRRLQRTVSDVAVSEAVRRYATRLAARTRETASLGASPRATIALLRAGQARAVMDGRDYVLPDDLRTEAVAVFHHRLQTETGDGDGRELVEDALSNVPVE